MPPRPPLEPDPQHEPLSRWTWPAVLVGLSLPALNDTGWSILDEVRAALRPVTRQAHLVLLAASIGAGALSWAAYRLAAPIGPDAGPFAAAAVAMVSMAAVALVMQRYEGWAWSVATAAYRRAFSKAVAAAGQPTADPSASSVAPHPRKDPVVASGWLLLDGATAALVAGMGAFVGAAAAATDDTVQGLSPRAAGSWWPFFSRGSSCSRSAPPWRASSCAAGWPSDSASTAGKSAGGPGRRPRPCPALSAVTCGPSPLRGCSRRARRRPGHERTAPPAGTASRGFPRARYARNVAGPIPRGDRRGSRPR